MGSTCLNWHPTNSIPAPPGLATPGNTGPYASAFLSLVSKTWVPRVHQKIAFGEPGIWRSAVSGPITLHLRNWWGLQRSWKVSNIWRQLRTGQTGQNSCHGCGPCHSIRAMGLVDRATGQGQDTKSDWDHISLLHALHDTLGWGSFGHQETIIAVSCSHPKVLIQFKQELPACARAWYGLRGRFEILEECVPSFASFFSYEPQVNKHQFCHHMLVVCNEVDHTNHYLLLPKVWGFETKGFFTLIISVIWACQKYAQQEQWLWITFKLLAKQRTNMCTVYSLYVSIYIYMSTQCLYVMTDMCK